MEKLSKKMLNRINNSNYKAFSSSDFFDLGNYKTISKCLERLEDSGKLKRARRGIYYLKNNSNFFGIDEPVDINEAAKAIARQYDWRIIPSGNYALNAIGLSTQIPSKHIFISSGPYNQYEIGNTTIFFKHTTLKEIPPLSYKNLLAIQALKAIGKSKISDEDLCKIFIFLDEADKKQLANLNNIRITAWIYDKLQKIIENKYKCIASQN